MATPTVREVRMVPCECCYCGVKNSVRHEPHLTTCSACGRDFRVIPDARTKLPLDLSSAAKLFYQHSPKRFA